MDLKPYLGGRIPLLMATLLGVVLVVFLLAQFLSPMQKVGLYVTSPRGFSNFPDVIAKYHLDGAIHVQFYYWVAKLLHGNLGWSKVVMMPVKDAFFSFLPATLELFIFTIPIIIWASIRVGVTPSISRDGAGRRVARIAPIAGCVVLYFLLGLLLVAVFYGCFAGLLPPGRLSSSAEIYVNSAAFARYTHMNTIDAILNLDFGVLVDALRHLIMPVATLVVGSLALLISIRRFGTNGHGGGSATEKHIRKNAPIPVRAASEYLIMWLIAGVIITETIFTFKGIGWFFVHAATQLDIPVVVGFTLIIAIIIVLMNFVVDFLSRVDYGIGLR